VLPAELLGDFCVHEFENTGAESVFEVGDVTVTFDFEASGCNLLRSWFGVTEHSITDAMNSERMKKG
jgi:hypothetical protein